MSTRRFYRRRFLNRPGQHAGAYALAEIRFKKGRGSNARPFVDAYLAIADCARVTRLDFDTFDEPDARNGLHKARLLREVVCDFVEAYEQAIEEWRGSPT